MSLKKHNQRILLVEESATLRYILAKSLQKQGYDLVSLESFEDAHRCIKDGVNDLDAAVIGWPNYKNHKFANDLMLLLEEPGCDQLPVLVISHDASLQVLNWMSSRLRAALIPWENYQECIASLQKLLGADKAVRPAISIQQKTKSIRILFVDDSISIRHYYQRLLQKTGYMVDVADSVASAFELALGHQYDLAIIDYFMPEENGYVLCEKLGKDKRTSNIITAVITGTYLDEAIKDCLQAGAVECMFKNEAEELFLARIAAMSRLVEVQKSIEAETERLAGILESVGEGVYGVDNAGRVTFVNPAAQSIVGAENASDIIGKLAKDIFHYNASNQSNENDRLYRAYGKGVELRCWETSFNHADGKAIPVECTVYPLKIRNKQEGSVIAFRDISERKMLEEKLHWQATHDHLTQLCNRRYFEEQLETGLSRAQQNGTMAALIYLDLDRFKYINDTAGHDAGDNLLIEISDLLVAKLSKQDLLARLGGDEFAIILHDVDQVAALNSAEYFRVILEQYNFRYDAKNYNIHASLGVAMMDVEGMTAGDVLANADIACHIAKRSGRNQTHLYEQSSDEKNTMGSELGWSRRIHDAMVNDDFILYYQPILDMKTIDLKDLPVEDGHLWQQYVTNPDNILHYELLLRMRGENDEIFFPTAFLPTAERFNLMLDVDMWVLNNAFVTLAEIHQDNPNVSFSINLSAHTVNTIGSFMKISELIEKYQVNPRSLIFEITETCAIANFELAVQFIDEMKWLGCRFSLDDFGSGFCSFSQLKCLPADFVKIDGQFVRGMARGAIDRAIVTAMNDVAHSLGRYTVAEYVESPEVLRLLKICGVDHVQGNYISLPLDQLRHGCY